MSRAGTIDGPRFAKAREAVTGALAISDLPRLAEMGCEAATLRYAVRGGDDADGRAALTVEVSGALQLACQRCLGALELPVVVTSVLELADSEAEIDAADDERDRVLASKSMDVAALIEDEVILALPMIPMHASCETTATREAGDKRSPFAALAGLQERGAGPRGPHRKSNT
jgi:DUF177 domain-containing protein